MYEASYHNPPTGEGNGMKVFGSNIKKGKGLKKGLGESCDLFSGPKNPAGLKQREAIIVVYLFVGHNSFWTHLSSS